MKTRLYILVGAAMLIALTSCEPKSTYTYESYVNMEETSVSVNEDAGELVLWVNCKSYDGATNTEVQFDIIDGEGDTGAKQYEDFSIVSPVNGLLTFYGDTTAAITFRISDANVGIYTGRKNFTVKLTNATNGYNIGGAYFTDVYIADVDKDANAGIAGTYAVHGAAYVSSGTAGDKDWALTIYEDEESGLYYLDGIVPSYTGGYETYGDFRYAPYGVLSDDGTQLVVPSQCSTEYSINSTSGVYYIGWTPCIKYEVGSFYYGTNYPDLTFTYNSEEDSWISDYGIFMCGCTSAGDITTFTAFFDVVVPTITMTKVD